MRMSADDDDQADQKPELSDPGMAETDHSVLETPWPQLIIICIQCISWRLREESSTNSLCWRSEVCIEQRHLADEFLRSLDLEAQGRLHSASSSSLIVRRTQLSTAGDWAFRSLLPPQLLPGHPYAAPTTPHRTPLCCSHNSSQDTPVLPPQLLPGHPCAWNELLCHVMSGPPPLNFLTVVWRHFFQPLLYGRSSACEVTCVIIRLFVHFCYFLS